MTTDTTRERTEDGITRRRTDQPDARDRRRDRFGSIVGAEVMTSLGAVLAAVLASACGWLPLLLLGTSAGVVGVSSFFAAHRPILLGLTGTLLAASFYYVYLRTPRCAPGDTCAAPNPRVRRLNRVALWVATAAAIGVATFPDYLPWFVGEHDAVATVSSPAAVTVTYEIEGMTCEACGSYVRAAIAELPGIRSVEVSFADGTAEVRFDGEVDRDAVVHAVDAAGYHARPRR
jgi:copper chaperone CopZ